MLEYIIIAKLGHDNNAIDITTYSQLYMTMVQNKLSNVRGYLNVYYYALQAVYC